MSAMRLAGGSVSPPSERDTVLPRLSRGRINRMTLAASVVDNSAPVLAVTGMMPPMWSRNVPPHDRRIGPWLTATYVVLDAARWKRAGACIYTVTGAYGGVRYVGKAEYRLTDRWRTSPAYDPVTRDRLPDRRLFHGQCWPHMTREYAADPAARFEVRVIDADTLAALTGSEASPVDVVTRVERELIATGNGFATWNGRQPCP
jgi:hypothetical protein